MSPRTILIPVTLGEDYPADLKKRLAEYGITNREVCEETGIEETQFSRMFRPSESSGQAVSPRFDTVAKIEHAIVKIRARKKRQAKKKSIG